MSSTLIAKSDELHNSAVKIIRDTSIEEIFTKLGSVEIIGSVRLNTMFRRDIDILVFSEDIDRQKAVDATDQLLGHAKFRSIALVDYQKFPGDDMPAGFYWELIIEVDGEDWKFDVWYLRSDEKYSDMVMTAIDRFEDKVGRDTQKRELILEIKEEYFNGEKYKSNVKGIDIYRAVLDKDIQSVEDFDKILNQST